MSTKQITLGELCEFRYGDSLPERIRIPGPVPVYGSNGIVGYHSQSVTQGETIIVGRKGSIGEVHYSGGPCFPIDTTYYISGTKRECNLKWLYYILRSLRLTELNKSSAVPGLNRNDAYEKKIVFPPLPIQKQIAAILEKADAAREKRRQANQLTEQFLQSAFLEMFGDPVTNPKGWETVSLANLLTFLTSGSRGWAKYYSESGDKFLRIQNVGRNALLLDDIAFVDAPNGTEANRTKVQAGDVLLSITADLGRTCVIPKDFGTAFINQHLSILRTKSINPVYLSAFIASEGGASQIRKLDRQGVKSGLNFDDIKSLRIMKPPNDRQQQFAALVEKVEGLPASENSLRQAGLRVKQRESERELENLFNSVMQRAFRGELIG
ncbi:MAG TPA: restriction endonuclease subunit S [Bacteroidota bacterium]|nr:restriction endonuclease subunit S [Bacteroidota bacterium]